MQSDKWGVRMIYFVKIMPSPVGALQLIATEKGLAAILWEGEDGRRVGLGPFVEAPDNAILLETERQLKLYFDGELKEFSIPLDFKGTEFQKSVWAALLTIPWGRTRSYGDIARQIGRPTAFRAVGAANGKNPVAIIAPCHRVVGSTGKLTGFAGGLAAKEFLLGIEEGSAASAARRQQFSPQTEDVL